MTVKEDVVIVDDGEIIAKLTYPQIKTHNGVNFSRKLTKRKNTEEIKRSIESVSGIIQDNGVTLSDYRTERLKKYENFA